jgi:hypothetical protein
MKRSILFVMFAFLTLMVGSAQAYMASSLGPGVDGHAILHVGDPVNGSFLYGGTVLVSISANGLQIQNNSGGKALSAPLWLILGVANDNGIGTAPKANGIAAQGVGAFTSGFLYDQMFHITGGGNSQNFGNWSSAELALTGITATQFGIYVYDFSAISLQDKDIFNIIFDSPLANGTFAVAASVWSNNQRGAVYATTPFTQTGFYHKVPEPGMLTLFGSGLLGLAFFGRKIRK